MMVVAVVMLWLNVRFSVTSGDAAHDGDDAAHDGDDGGVGDDGDSLHRRLAMVHMRRGTAARP